MTITSQFLLIPLPLGVTLIIETTADQPTFNIQTGGIVTGETATINWGDGTSDDFTRIYNASHTYAKPGIYRIEISDVLSAISIAVADAFANYAAIAFRPACVPGQSGDSPFERLILQASARVCPPRIIAHLPFRESRP